MKKDIHPQSYRPVVFQDQGSGDQFIIGSTVQTDQKITVDGTEYPLYVVEISSATHPFYTGIKTTIDRAGRVDKFKQRALKAKKK
jgi:large subunit ribosomal protein L31